MELFRKIQSLLQGEATVTITVRSNKDGRLTVCTAFSGHKVTDGLSPLMMRGTADELDEGFTEALGEHLPTVRTLVTNAKDFEESAAKAANEAAGKKPDDARKKIEEAKKAAEEKAQKAADLMAKAKDASGRCAYHTAAALYGKAIALTDDARKKKEAEALLAKAKQDTSSFFCTDTKEDADRAVADTETPQPSDGGKAEAPDPPTENADDDEGNEVEEEL